MRRIYLKGRILRRSATRRRSGTQRCLTNNDGLYELKIGNMPVPGVKQRFIESKINENGALLTNFCSMHSLRINNTFFKHNSNHKITWSDSRGRHSMIDYIITNQNIHPSQNTDVTAFKTADIGSDHRLVIAKFRVSAQLL
jgi:hypothetical protein